MTQASDRLNALLGRIPAKNVTVATKPQPSTERPNIPPELIEEIVEEHFTKGKWHHLTNHICHCGGAFLDPQTAAEHWVSQHSGWTPPPDTDIVEAQVVGAGGEPIYKEVEVEPDKEKENDE